MSDSPIFNKSKEFSAKLNIKYYICTVLLAGFSAFGWYGIYFLNANTVLIENAPMSDSTKILFTSLMAAIILSWTLSFFVMLRQIIIGKAFVLDKSGIHNTVSATGLLAFIFIVPVKYIPYSAIQSIEKHKKSVTITIDKSKVTTTSVFRPLVRKNYNFFNEFTTAKTDDIYEYLPK